MADRIKGITIELNGDATGLDKALKGVNNNIRNTEAQLRDVNKLLKLDPRNTELLAQKQRLLSKEINDTKEKLKTLKTASEQAKKSLEMGKITQSQYDALQREIIETENNLKKLEGQARETGNEMKDSGEKGTKGFNAKEFGEKAAKIGKAFLEMAAAVGAALVAMGKKFADLAKQTAEYGDNVDKMSQKLGMSAEAYQKWDFVLQQNGASIESLKAPMKTLATQAQNNSKAFEKLGISQDDLSKLSQEELFEKTIGQLQKMEAGTERTALASELFGKASTDLQPLLNQTAEETENLKKQAEEYGLVLSDEAVKNSAEFNDSLNLMNKTMEGLKNRIVSEFFPALTQITDGLANVFKGDMGGIEQVKKGINEFISKMKEMSPQVIEIGKSILTGLVQIISENIGSFGEVGVQLVSALATALVQALPTLVTAADSLLSITVDLIPQLLDSILAVLPVLLEKLGTILPQIVVKIIEIVPMLIDSLVSNIPLLIEGATLFLMGIVEALPTITEALTNALPTLISSFITMMISNTPLILKAAIQLFMGIVKAIPQIAIQVGRQIPNIIRGIVNGLKSGISQVANVGRDLIKGLWNGISNMAQWIYSKIKGFGAGVLNALKSFFKIGSPSRVMADEVGKWLAEGIGVGFINDMSKVTDKMTSAIDIPDIKSEASMNASMIMPTSLTNMLGQYLPYLANQNQAIVLDTGVLVGQTAPMYNKAFGRMIRSGV